MDKKSFKDVLPIRNIKELLKRQKQTVKEHVAMQSEYKKALDAIERCESEIKDIIDDIDEPKLRTNKVNEAYNDFVKKQSFYKRLNLDMI